MLTLTVVVILLAVEGLSSLLVISRETGKLPPVDGYVMKERTHSQYDPLLGWVNIPGLSIPDMYGPGTTFTTNSRGFRNDRDFEKRIPAGKRRVICSGDSFTMGFGVGDEETWCRQLSVLDPGLETVNMGQGGYGIDQSYLWYHRDGLKMDHDVHIFAFPLIDIYRVQHSDFWGFGKPVLTVRNNELQVGNTPVPKRFYHWPKIELTVHRYLSYLNFAKVLKLNVPDPGFDFRNRMVLSDEEMMEVTSGIVDALLDDAVKMNADLLLVLLPIHVDADDPSSDGWRRWLEEETDRRGIAFLDLIGGTRERIPPDQWEALFRDPVTGHYTPEGHALIASMIGGHLPGR